MRFDVTIQTAPEKETEIHKIFMNIKLGAFVEKFKNRDTLNCVPKRIRQLGIPEQQRAKWTIVIRLELWS